MIETNEQLFAAAAERLMRCECCGGNDDLGINRLASKSLLCRHCLYVWYDEAGTTDANVIRRLSLERQTKLKAESTP
jgi:hypothetical protein